MNSNLKEQILRFLIWIKIQVLFVLDVKKVRKQGIDNRLWKRKFLNLWKTRDVRCNKLLDEFLNCSLKKISNHKVIKKRKYSPILFCVIKNDFSKIHQFMEHYRKLGVEVFVFLDNDSNDGTKEFLCQQKDAVVYYSNQQYSSARRVAWLNRLLAIYGENKWCLIVDSDELITYMGAEEYQLTDIVERAIDKKCKRVEGFLLDMYSDNDIFQRKNDDSCLEKYKYFDINSYKLHTAENGLVVSRGPRKRIFHAEVCLSKYPMFFFGRDDFIASSHYIIPFEPISKCPMWFAICHYKFIDDKDLDKIKEAVRKENYACGSQDYKKYLLGIKRNPRINFYEEGNSCEMKNSYSLKNISFLKTPFK